MNCFIYLVIYLFVSIRLPTACDIDLGLVMDNTKGNFVLIKDFAKHLVGKFRISDDGTHLAGSYNIRKNSEYSTFVQRLSRQQKQLAEC